MTTTITLPGPVARYVQAANAHDAAAVAACFSATGTVRDEGHVHQGHAAIAAWCRQVNADYAPTSTVLAFAPAASGGVATIEVAGTFPGSPLPLRFHFTLDANAIATLEVTP